ncbi:MAG: hypothetical protein ABUS79_18740 [Pseudomonadota bacterium]
MKKSRIILPALCGLSLALAAPSTVLAQEATTTTTTTTTTPAPVVTSRNSSGAGIGVGGAAFLSGLTGVQGVYDTSAWHAEALFAFDSTTGVGPGDTTITRFQFGARGWYHLHEGTHSDFSAGAGAGIITASGGGASATAVLIEPGVLARAFLTPNFALHATGGLSMVFGDSLGGPTNTGFRLTTQLLAGLGFTYFFR